MGLSRRVLPSASTSQMRGGSTSRAEEIVARCQSSRKTDGGRQFSQAGCGLQLGLHVQREVQQVRAYDAGEMCCCCW